MRLNKLLTTPPHRIPPKTWKKIRRAFQAHYQRRRDVVRPTYLAAAHSALNETYQPVLPADLLQCHASTILALAQKHLDHRFNLLGSGWVRVEHGMSCAGLGNFRHDPGGSVQADGNGDWLAARINPANLAEAQQRWRLVDQGYRPIDWQLDFKSGFRWGENIWSRDVVYGNTPGADVKVPWELSRMQHLPVLALAFAIGGPDQHRYVREFRNQVLDFTATNPPRYGVNWSCTMDVAIRVVNWLIAYDLFRGHGAVFDADFDSLLCRAVCEHGQHIAGNLEWNEQMVGNHYLADVAGLLIVAAHLSAEPRVDTWLVFAVQQLLQQTVAQFHPEGSNFEASTCYHRLSAEMVVYATAILLGLPLERWHGLSRSDESAWTGKPALEPVREFMASMTPGNGVSLPPWYCDRLERMALFAVHMTNPCGDAVQIGDNDSGRFVRLVPEPLRAENVDDLFENVLDHRSVVAAINGLFCRTDLDHFVGAQRLEKELVMQLAGGVQLPSTQGNPTSAAIGYPDFGAYVVRRLGLFVAIRCGSVGQNGHGGHAHHDQLSFELCLDDQPLVVDPGTYLYTPWREMRALFRSTQMHSTLRLRGTALDRQPDPAGPAFALERPEAVEVVLFTAEQWVGVRRAAGAEHRRLLRFADGLLVGTEECTPAGTKTLTFPLAPGVEPRSSKLEDRMELYVAGRRVAVVGGTGVWSVREGLYSPAYGVAQPCALLTLDFTGATCHWSFSRGAERAKTRAEGITA